MSEQRFVLVAWPPTDSMVFAGNSHNNGWNFGYCMNKAVAASPVAADDPAMVERVARTACRRGCEGEAAYHGKTIEEYGRSCCYLWDDYSDDALSILRLFSPPKE